MRPEYITVKHPKTGKLWIMGHCGGGQYVQIREVVSDAKKEIIHLMQAEQAQRADLKGI